jgi:hypothetical protein
LDPKWALRWLQWQGRGMLGLPRRGADFGDIFYVRRIQQEQPLEQFLHVPSRTHIRRLLDAAGFQLVGAVREMTVKHHPTVWLARKKGGQAEV